jgi:hypothetical protein
MLESVKNSAKELPIVRRKIVVRSTFCTYSEVLSIYQHYRGIPIRARTVVVTTACPLRYVIDQSSP